MKFYQLTRCFFLISCLFLFSCSTHRDESVETAGFENLEKFFHDSPSLTPRDWEWIQKRYLAKKSANQAAPSFWMITGLPGAGKTTYYQKEKVKFHNFVFMDPDEIVVNLEGYQEKYRKSPSYAVNHYRPIATKLSKVVTQTVLDQKQNIVYVGPLGPDTLKLFTRHSKKNNYQTFLNIFVISPEEAKRRIIRRAIKESRNIESSLDSLICEHCYYLGKVFTTLETLEGITETNVILNEGKKPLIKEIHDPKDFQEFLPLIQRKHCPPRSPIASGP